MWSLGNIFGTSRTYCVLVLSVQWCVVWDLHHTSQQRSFNQEGHHHFGFCKSMTKEARRQERKLSCESKHWHQVPSEPGHSFTSPESQMLRDWRWTFDGAQSPSLASWVLISVDVKTHPRGLVRSSLGLRIPGRCSMTRSFFSHHSWMSTCQGQGVGCFSLIK